MKKKTSTISIIEDILYIKSLIGRPDELNRVFFVSLSLTYLSKYAL